jgi:hypothetical protein
MVPGVGGSTDYIRNTTVKIRVVNTNQRIIAGLPLAGGATNVHLREQGPQPAGISTQARLELRNRLF